MGSMLAILPPIGLDTIHPFAETCWFVPWCGGSTNLDGCVFAFGSDISLRLSICNFPNLVSGLLFCILPSPLVFLSSLDRCRFDCRSLSLPSLLRFLDKGSRGFRSELSVIVPGRQVRHANRSRSLHKSEENNGCSPCMFQKVHEMPPTAKENSRPRYQAHP